MAISYKIWDFPNVLIRSQLFHVPGISFEGGLTAGGARISSPEPGGRSVLEMQVSMQTKEWTDFPFASWIASKINGEIFRIQLIKTPQIVSDSAIAGNDPGPSYGDDGVLWENTALYTDDLWDTGLKWAGDGFFLEPNAIKSEGYSTFEIDTDTLGEILKHGHLIGHDNYTYIIDDIEYDGAIATVTVKPPLRKNIALEDAIYTRPYFLGAIANGDQIRSLYEADKLGNIEVAKLIFTEVII